MKQVATDRASARHHSAPCRPPHLLAEAQRFSVLDEGGHGAVLRADLVALVGAGGRERGCVSGVGTGGKPRVHARMAACSAAPSHLVVLLQPAHVLVAHLAGGGAGAAAFAGRDCRFSRRRRQLLGRGTRAAGGDGGTRACAVGSLGRAGAAVVSGSSEGGRVPGILAGLPGLVENSGGRLAARRRRALLLLLVATPSCCVWRAMRPLLGKGPAGRRPSVWLPAAAVLGVPTSQPTGSPDMVQQTRERFQDGLP